MGYINGRQVIQTMKWIAKLLQFTTSGNKKMTAKFLSIEILIIREEMENLLEIPI
jgi:hypothetical protein